MSDVKYLPNGQRVELVKAIDGGFLVQDIIAHVKEFPHDEPTEFYADDHVYLVEKVFDTAPTKVYDDTIATLEARIASLHAEAASIRDSNAAAKNLERDRMARLTQIKKLELLDDYISGKITHYAVCHEYYEPEVLVAADAVTENDRWNKKLRLLSLFGDSKGDLTWELSQYSSPAYSGWTKVMPARSLAEAEEFIRKYLVEQMAAVKLDRYGACIPLVGYAEKRGVDIPPALAEAVNGYRAKARQSNIAELRKEITERTAKLTALGATA